MPAPDRRHGRGQSAVVAALSDFMGAVMFKHVALIGLGLIGSSLGHAVKRQQSGRTHHRL